MDGQAGCATREDARARHRSSEVGSLGAGVNRVSSRMSSVGMVGLLLHCQGEDILMVGSLKLHGLRRRYSPCTGSIGKLTLKRSPSIAMPFVTGSHFAAGKLAANSSLYSVKL